MPAANTIASGLVVALGAAAFVVAQSPPAGGPVPVLFEGARLVLGDARAPIEAGAFVVRSGRIVAIGPRGTVTAPRGARRVDLTGKTVMPAMINVHVHIGYEGYTSWGAENYTPANVLDHLQREAYYGVAVTQSVGSSPTDAAIQFQRNQEAGAFPPASRFLFMPGMAPPNGGPDAILMKGTSALRAVYEVTTGDEARAAVRGMAGKQLKNVKIWVDDRRGTYPKMSPEVYNAVIDEAHRHGMKVQAHAIALADQKAVVKAGADVLVHTVQNERLDEEFLALLREKRPYWTTVIGLGDRTEVCDREPFIDRTYPDSVLATIRETSCGPLPANAAQREDILAYNLPKMIANGARLVLGTDAGITARHAFGWADHHELTRWVRSGLSPAQAIVAATSRPAELLGLTDAGVLAAGKRADFIVLGANPLEDIRNTRAIVDVYLGGTAVDRDALAARWKLAAKPG
ncbi:MAG TPA: amidohydrolase family protein [Vicinamibacterales bacterium]|nr:amidohydrolase family protein [Vicinamibacterales bacterium]